MNKLTYRFTLDTHKNGIQRVLQGFETGDTIDRILEISLTANGQVVELSEADSAVLYVRSAGQVLSMDATRIEGNTVRCRLSNSSLAVAGMAECQLVVFDSFANQLFSPKFQIEIWQSLIALADEAPIPMETYEALQQAISDVDRYRGTVIESIDFKNAEEGDYTLVFERRDDTLEVPGLTEKLAQIKEAAKGDKGDQGDAATIEVGSVTTVNSSADAEVENIGDETNAIFNFKIPRGPSAVVVSNTEPTDESVKIWLNPDGDVDALVTEAQVSEMISEAIGGALNGRY